MKKFFLFLFLAIGINTNGQVYHPFPTDSAMWINVTHFDDNTWWNNTPVYHITGEDTVINGTPYNKLFENNIYIGGLREDSLKKVYFVSLDSTNEHLIYDFSLSAGDTVWVWGHTGGPFGFNRLIIESEDSILLANGEVRRVLNINDQQNPSDQWIEGIGSTYGLLTSGCFSSLRVIHLTQFILKGVIVYPLTTSIEKADMFQANLIVSPNPFSTQLTFSHSNSSQATISLYNFLGQQVLQQTVTNSATINTEQLADGIYFYELRNDKGLVANGKVIRQ